MFPFLVIVFLLDLAAMVCKADSGFPAIAAAVAAVLLLRPLLLLASWISCCCFS